MDRFRLLLTKLAEECVEVAQVALKTQQFGFDSRYPHDDPSNLERTHEELDDLMGVVEMLNEEFGFSYKPNRERIEAKKAKVNKYCEYSRRLGMVNDEEKEGPISQQPLQS